MATWCFKSALQRTRLTSMQRWYWQIDTQNTLIAVTSKQLFSTIDECIENARAYGFKGEVDLPEDMTHPAFLTCEQGDYLHAVVQRSVRERAYRML